MIFTKQERLTGIVAACVVGAVGLYYFVLDPYLIQPRIVALDKLAKCDDEVKANKKTEDAWKDKQKELTKLQDEGLKTNPSEAEASLSRAINEWIKPPPNDRNGVVFVSQKIDPRNISLAGDAYYEKSLTFVGTGNTLNIGWLVWRIQNTPQPIKLNSVSITSRKDGIDDLQVMVNISTICQNPDVDKKATPAAPAAPAKEN